MSPVMLISLAIWVERRECQGEDDGREREEGDKRSASQPALCIPLECNYARTIFSDVIALSSGEEVVVK